MTKGLIHLYTGDGKGKTTAALGLLLRAHGCGKRVVLVQFLKGRDTGEIKALECLSDITVLRYTHDYGFFNTADEKSKNEMIRINNANLLEAIRLSDSGSCDLLILDEVCAAYQNNALDTKLVDKLIREKPVGLELVLTGRNAPQCFVDNADYITEFVKHKHPYDNGITAREGVEY